MKRQPTLLEALSTMRRHGDRCHRRIRWVRNTNTSIIDIIICIRSIYRETRRIELERFRRRDYEAVSYGDASDLHHSICGNYCW